MHIIRLGKGNIASISEEIFASLIAQLNDHYSLKTLQQSWSKLPWYQIA